MTDSVNISDFSYSGGFNIGNDDENFVYLYGLADFWQYLFKDTSINNLLLETTSVQASDIYNNFLQLCSGISLQSLASAANSQLRLEIIPDTIKLPYEVPIVSGSFSPLPGLPTTPVSEVLNSGSVITVVWPSHGFSTSIVIFSGWPAYNGEYAITVTSVDTFTFTPLCISFNLATAHRARCSMATKL